jgi:hypothetical protein
MTKTPAPAVVPAPAAGVKWLADVADHDYEAALNYLSLLLDERRAKIAVNALKYEDGIVWRRANDILRAAGRPALSLDDPGVRRDLGKLLDGEKLSPVLVVSFSNGGDIADGYHRVSLSAGIDPFSEVPCRLANIPSLKDVIN